MRTGQRTEHTSAAIVPQSKKAKKVPDTLRQLRVCFIGDGLQFSADGGQAGLR